MGTIQQALVHRVFVLQPGSDGSPNSFQGSPAIAQGQHYQRINDYAADDNMSLANTLSTSSPNNGYLYQSYPVSPAPCVQPGPSSGIGFNCTGEVFEPTQYPQNMPGWNYVVSINFLELRFTSTAEGCPDGFSIWKNIYDGYLPAYVSTWAETHTEHETINPRTKQAWTRSWLEAWEPYFGVGVLTQLGMTPACSLKIGAMQLIIDTQASQ